VREALARLVAEGRVYKIKGKGAFVSEPTSAGEFVSTTMGFWEEMSAKGRHVRTRVLDQRLRAPTRQERKALRLPDREQVLALRRLYLVDGTPTILVTTTLPASLVPGLERVNLQNNSLYQTLRERYGLAPFRAERWLEATLPEDEEAALLDVPRAMPLLRIESTAFLHGGEVLEHYRALQRTDEIRLHVVSH
jgi:GntR family transcriptional regulator